MHSYIPSSVGVRPHRFVLCATLLLTLAGCGGDSSGGTTQPAPTPAIAVALSAATGGSAGAGTASTTITLTRMGNYTGEVSLVAQGAPAGVTVAFSPTSLSGGTSSSTATISVAASTALGSYPISLAASGVGVASKSANFQLTVTAAPDFSLLATPDTVTVTQGTSQPVGLVVSRSGGFASNMALSYSATSGPLFGGIGISFSRDSVLGSAVRDSVTITIAVQISITAGNYPITVRATAANGVVRTAPFVVRVVAPPAAGSLSFSTRPAISVQGSASAPVSVVLARAAGVSGSATFSIDEVPPLVTAVFTPNPVVGDSTQLVFTTSPNQPPGEVRIAVRATVGTRSVVDTLLLRTLTYFPPDFGIATSVPTVVVTAGSSIALEVRVQRSGGFVGAVSVVLEGAPSGMTATLSPASIAGELGTLTIAAAANLPPVIYPLTLRATGVGITGTRSAPLSVAVNGSSGNTIAWRFCEASRLPIWFATRSGATTGAWTMVTPSGNGTFTFDYPTNGQVVYVRNGAAGTVLELFQHRPSEMFQRAAAECVDFPGTKSLTGTVAGVDILQGMSVAVGGADTTAVAAPSAFALHGVANRTTDLLATRGSYSPTNGHDLILRAIVRRNINPAAGSALPLLDFGSSEWIQFAGSNGTLFGFGTDSLRTEMALLTANGLVGTYYRDLPSRDSARVHWGLPPGATAASDLLRLTGIATHAVTPRRVVSYRKDVGFYETSVGPRLEAPSLSIVSSAPVQLRMFGAWSADYGFDVTTTYRQGASPSMRTTIVHSDRAYFGAASSTYNLILPDFSGVTGWNADWAFQSGMLVSYEQWVSGLSGGASLAPASGLTVQSGGYRGSVTP